MEELFRTTADFFVINDVSADKAYLSRKNLHAVDDVGGVAYIPFRSVSRARPTGTDKRRPDALWEKMFHYFMARQDEFYQHYHKRSNVETTFHMIKSKFGGEVLMSKTDMAKVNETLLRVLCHNLCVLVSAMYILGVEPTFSPKVLRQSLT